MITDKTHEALVRALADAVPPRARHGYCTYVACARILDSAIGDYETTKAILYANGWRHVSGSIWTLPRGGSRTIQLELDLTRFSDIANAVEE